MKDLLQTICEYQAGVYYCCYCLQPQDEKIVCCQENHFVAFNDLYQQDQQQIAQEIING